MRAREPGQDGGTGAGGPLLHLGKEEVFPLVRALGREWLEADGLGGYASSTVVLCPTRREHGLLVTRPPGIPRLHVFLSRFEEVLHRPEREFPISTGRYPGTWQPTGHAALHAFELAPHPVFVYRLGTTTVTREILLLRGRPIVLCRYRLDSTREDVELRLRPLLAFREATALTHENLHLDPRVERRGAHVYVRPYEELPLMVLRVSGGEAVFEADPVWYRNVEYQRDLERGHEGHEDNFNPGWFSIPFHPGCDVVVAASLGEDVSDPLTLWDEEQARRRQAAPVPRGGIAARLEYAARTFPFTTPTGRAAIRGGFPWPAESARETSIAAPALLEREPPSALARVLEGLLPFLAEGLLPTRVAADVAGSEYDGVDPSLWFGWAVRQLEKAGGDTDPFADALTSIAESFLAGAPLGIRVSDDGLLQAGREDLAVTWMDARIDGRPVTPRHGYAVEVNALWYHHLVGLERLAERRGDAKALRRWRALRRRARRAFLERFWIPERGRLADAWRDGRRDESVRPNMVIAAALEWSPLSRSQRADIVECARAELLTPAGLRTLSPQHALYRGRVGRRPAERDAAAHQGAAWPWLLGPYVEARVRAFGTGRRRIAALVELLEALAPRTEEGGLTYLSELFDGNPPHDPGGAPARASSVAGPLRARRILQRGMP